MQRGIGCPGLATAAAASATAAVTILLILLAKMMHSTRAGGNALVGSGPNLARDVILRQWVSFRVVSGCDLRFRASPSNHLHLWCLRSDRLSKSI